MFSNQGVIQPEVVGNLNAATITVDFTTGTTNASFAGSFADGGNGGSFTLNGGLANALKSSTFAAFDLTGNVVSGQMSTTSGNNCSASCVIYGHTDLQAIGGTAQGVGGVFHADTRPHGSVPVFGVVGTYLLER